MDSSDDTSSPSPFSSIPPSPAEDDDPQQIKAYLEKLSAAVVKSFDATYGDDNFAVARRYCASDFELDNRPEHAWPRMLGLDAVINHTRNLKRANPDWVFHAYNFTTVLDKERQKAVVWFTSGSSGGTGAGPGGSAPWWTTNRESVSQLGWRRCVDKVTGECGWECWRHTVIRGGGGFAEVGV